VELLALQGMLAVFSAGTPESATPVIPGLQLAPTVDASEKSTNF
jgi:hypothetical protein